MSENRHIIKEYHFYINDDRTHDTYFVQHCFGKFYDSLKNRGITFNEHWIWLDRYAGQFKSARSFLSGSQSAHYHVKHHGKPTYTMHMYLNIKI